MLGSGVDVRYVMAVLAAFDEFRSTATRAETAYLRRLTAFADMLPGLGSSERAQEPVGYAARLVARGARWAGAVLNVARCVAAMPSAVAQAKRLDVLARSEIRSGLIVGIASNRLSFTEQSPSARAQLASLAATLGGGLTSDVAGKMHASDYVLLFDAVPVSALWQHRDKCWEDNVFIVDAAFLFVFWVRCFLRDPRREWRATLRLLRECYAVRSQWKPGSRGLIEAVCSLLVMRAYSQLIGGSVESEAVFFTSNSILTELLRAFLIQCQSCRRVCEIMHGIGSIPAERFFSAVLSAGRQFGAYDKHFFVPQVPHLPLYGVLEKQARYGSNVAINTYLNKYFLERSARLAEEFIESEYRALCGGQLPSQDPVILTIFGNRPNDGRMFDSPSFQAESLLISLIAQFRKAMKTQYLTLYVPHPAHPFAAFRRHPVFADNGVSVYRDSVFCWLISDLCVSLVSSAMFEAVYFGARGFTPLVAADGLFTESYLALLNHPQSASFDDLVDALRTAMADTAVVPGTRVVPRAAKRLELMKGNLSGSR